MFYINAAGDITFHTCKHNPADRTFIRKEDLKLIFSGKAINLEHEDPLGNRYLVIGQPIYKDRQITSAIYVMASLQSMDKSLTAIRNLLTLSGLGAFLLAMGLAYIRGSEFSLIMKITLVILRFSNVFFSLNMHIQRKRPDNLLWSFFG